MLETFDTLINVGYVSVVGLTHFPSCDTITANIDHTFSNGRKKMRSKEIKATDVFVPGGFPRVTYVSREEHQLEMKVGAARNNLSKLVVVTGPTKSGKTVLVDKIFPREDCVWIDGGTISSEGDFWDSIIEQTDQYTEIEQVEDGALSLETSGEANVEGSLLFAKGSASLHVGAQNTTGHSVSTRRATSAKVVAIKAIQELMIPLIVDDFHYIDKPTQKLIVRALKSPIMHGVAVIFIAIPNRKYDAVEVEREMTGRIENVEMPVWTELELSKIAASGFNALNVLVPNSLIQRLSSAAYGSPFLMQEFCRELCTRSEITVRTSAIQYISDRVDEAEVFSNIAEHSGRSMFDKLKRGPRARTDRKPRTLKNGTVTDIYGVVMEALKNLKPGTVSVSYDTLRANIREVLADELPQKHEISRVLDKIAEISYTDASSTPVIDWQSDDDLLTITDPFFAFFLKWSR